MEPGPDLAQGHLLLPRVTGMAGAKPQPGREQGEPPDSTPTSSRARRSYQRLDRHTGQPVPGKFEFAYRDSAGRQRWQTAKGDTRADAKAERAEMVARLHRGERVERSSRTLGEVAEVWLERGRGKKGPWDAPTRERYERVVRQQVVASADPTRRPLGETKLRDVTVDRVAVWSQGNEQALAPSTASLALIALNQIRRYAVRRGWTGVKQVMQLEPGEKPRRRGEPVRIWRARPSASSWRTQARPAPCSSSSPTPGFASARRWGFGGVMWTSRALWCASASSFPGSARRSASRRMPPGARWCSPPP